MTRRTRRTRFSPELIDCYFIAVGIVFLIVGLTFAVVSHDALTCPAHLFC